MSEAIEQQSEIPARPPSVPRSRIVQFAAYVGAVSIPLYQLMEMIACGGGDLFSLPPIELLLRFAISAAIGAGYGVVAAGAFFLFRWFFKLDGQL